MEYICFRILPELARKYSLIDIFILFLANHSLTSPSVQSSTICDTFVKTLGLGFLYGNVSCLLSSRICGCFGLKLSNSIFNFYMHSSKSTFEKFICVFSATINPIQPFICSLLDIIRGIIFLFSLKAYFASI